MSDREFGGGVLRFIHHSIEALTEMQVMMTSPYLKVCLARIS